MLYIYSMRVFCFICILVFASSCSKEKRSEKAAEKMVEFVSELSTYAKNLDPNFLVIPQNGAELAFNYQDINDGLNQNYLSYIDGVGIESLFYNGSLNPDEERLNMLREVVTSKTILVSDNLSDDSNMDNAVSRNSDEGFLAFPRSNNNYDYLYIPDTIYYENADDVLNLLDAENYLYLISTDAYTDRESFISAIEATNYDLVIIDAFFDNVLLSPADVGRMKIKANGGQRLVIAYINVGAAENYRYYWQEKWKLHKPNWLKKPYDGYEDEIWVQFWKSAWKDIIFRNSDSYIDKILISKFDGAYLDNVEAYYFLYFD